MPGIATQRFTVLDSFRGLAAMAIVFCHLPILLVSSSAEVFRSSQLFVQFFFVLSGFVLLHAYGNRLTHAAALRDLMINRTLRLYPLHLCMFALLLLLQYGKLLSAHYGLGLDHAAFSGPTALREIFPNLLLLQAWLPGADSLSFNAPAWSISIGFYLCLVFGALLILLPRRAGMGFLILAVLSCVGLSMQVQGLKPEILQGASGFFAGALLYRLYAHLRALPLSRRQFTLLEITVLLLLALVLDSDYRHRDLLAGLLFLLTVFIFAFQGGVASQLLKARWLQALGLWSFSIYMTHFAVLLILQNLLVQAEPLSNVIRAIGTRQTLPDILLASAGLLTIILVAAITYRYIELPGIALGKRLLGRSSQLRFDEKPQGSSG